MAQKMVVLEIKMLKISRNSEEAKAIEERYIPEFTMPEGNAYLLEDIVYHTELFCVVAARLTQSKYILVEK